MRTAILLVVYAVVLAGTGVLVWRQAPDPSRAMTALIVPASAAVLVLSVAGLARLWPRFPGLGRFGLGAGVVLPLVLALGIGFQAWRATQQVSRYESARLDWEKAAVPREEPDLAAFLAARGAPDHDVTYKRDGLWALTGTSLLACVLALRTRRADLARLRSPS